MFEQRWRQGIAMRANAAIGIAVVLLTAAELAMIRRSPPHVSA